MLVRDVRESDLPEIAYWFEKRKWPFPAIPNIFPKLGAVAVSGEELIACAWIYTTETSLAFLQWTATNPNVTEKLGNLGLTEVISKLKDGCRLTKPKILALCQYTPNEKLARHYMSMGFVRKDNYFQLLWTTKNKD